MEGWALPVSILCLAAGVFLFLADRMQIARQVLQMRKMRGSKMYTELYATVERVREYDLDEIRIERDRITFFSIYPPGRIADFDLEELGYRFLDKQRIFALAQNLALDIPQLQRAADYRLRRYRVMRPNGTRDDAYLFSAKEAYKMRVLSAAANPALRRVD